MKDVGIHLENATDQIGIDDGRVVEHDLAATVEKVRLVGRGRPYDCVVGVSGGTDSSYVLLRAVELGLRPLAVHLDNGWRLVGYSPG